MGGVPIPGGIARWTGTSWADFSYGIGNPVLSCLGFRPASGALPAALVAAGTGYVEYDSYTQSWEVPHTACILHPGWISTMAIWDTGSEERVCAGGSFEIPPGWCTPAHNLAYFVNGDPNYEWKPLAEGLEGTVFAILPLDSDRILVGGCFSVDIEARGTLFNLAVARSDGSWEQVGPSLEPVLDTCVNALAKANGMILIGGDFEYAGSTRVNSIVAWDGYSYDFTPLGTGVTLGLSGGSIQALDSDGTSVYAAGYFYDAGLSPSHLLARWHSPGAVAVQEGEVRPLTRSPWAAAAPNPFGDATWVTWGGIDGVRGSVRIFNVSGRLIRELRNGSLLDGMAGCAWDGRDGSGRAVTAGIYFVRVADDRGVTATGKVVRSR